MTTNQAKPSPSAEDEPPLQHEEHRILPTPFLTKTFQLVDDPSIVDIISWNEDGSTFVVWRPAEFARDILPKYFKHNNFSSFVRQLNTYGFRKIVPDRWEFAHDCFRRGEKRLLCDIHRRKILSATAPSPNQVGTPVSSGDEQVVSTTTSPGGAPHPGLGSIGTSPDLAEENDRLRRENKQLSRELGEMRSVCGNIVQLMSKYSPCRRNGATVPDGGGEAASKTLPLDMQLGRSSAMDKDEEDTMNGTSMDTRLFGVSIGLKRNRGEESGVASRSALDVKQEPLDGVGQQ